MTLPNELDVNYTLNTVDKVQRRARANKLNDVKLQNQVEAHEAYGDVHAQGVRYRAALTEMSKNIKHEQKLFGGGQNHTPQYGYASNPSKPFLAPFTGENGVEWGTVGGSILALVLGGFGAVQMVSAFGGGALAMVAGVLVAGSAFVLGANKGHEWFPAQPATANDTTAPTRTLEVTAPTREQAKAKTADTTSKSSEASIDMSDALKPSVTPIAPKKLADPNQTLNA